MDSFPGSSKSGLIILLTIGFCAIPSQIILLREMLVIISANELIIGLFLAIWMLLTAAGSYTGRFFILRGVQLQFCTVLLAWLPVILLYMIDLLRNRIFLAGIDPGLIPVILALILFLLPFCFLSGLLFSSASVLFTSRRKDETAGKAYGIESLGSVAGGLLFSLVLVYLYDNFRAAGTIAVTGSLLVLTYGYDGIKRRTTMILIPLLIILAVVVLITGSQFARQFLYRNQKLLDVRDTPYGNLAVTGTSDQVNVFENSVLLYSSDNALESEEAVHFAMLQHPLPHSVLLISGGISGLTREILKYRSVTTLDYMEIDPAIPVLAKKFTSFLDQPEINTLTGDARIYLRTSEIKYDVVIVYLPPPHSLLINRFYTLEFVRSVRSCLHEDGIFSFSLPLDENYMNEGITRLYSSLVNTVKPLFNYLSIFPGQRACFVASDRNIKRNISQLIEILNIETDYVNSYYINEAEMERRTSSIIIRLIKSEDKNTDFKPVAITGSYEYWLDRFHVDFDSFRIYSFAIIALLIIALAISSPAYSGMFAAGFTTSALLVILLLSFQIVYGYVYRSMGLFTAFFMAGLAAGAIYRGRFIRSAKMFHLICLQFVLAVFSTCIPPAISLSSRLIQMPVAVHLIYLLAIALISVVTGLVFSLSVPFSDRHGRDFPAVYGADLVGASIGAFATTLLIIPMMGIKAAPYLTGLLNLAAGGIMLLRFRGINHVKN